MEFHKFDEVYIENLRVGDPRTEAHFVSYFSELIHLKLRSRLNSRDAIEDVRQETFARVFALLRGKEGIRNAAALGALVNSICNNVLLEQYRSQDRSDSMEDASEMDIPAEGRSVLGEVISMDTRKIVGRILDQLPARDRLLLKGIFLEERDKDEICRELGVDREYLRVLVHRAKQSFKSSYIKQIKSPPGSGGSGSSFGRHVYAPAALLN
ncbi:RNA polymerase sigma factor [Paracidobacterium acidisoli]|uniref:RNA polymerase sigma factor n=1 Tax=Paracidobacterium acidisoli TaxID=2303751 RepID=UPI001313F989|nr:sigma-70 family RNA polymerase sigma factor [Paracidobacterium acidisoli]MBT9330731.1 sigma-70 family RNA polymerase sigma factor [Paracidobacterium acidisoli]